MSDDKISPQVLQHAMCGACGCNVLPDEITSNDHLPPALGRIRAADMGDEKPRARETDVIAEHTLTAYSADGTELFILSCVGTMPVPAVGEVIGLHDEWVRVVSVLTRYGRSMGRPSIFTQIVVESDDEPDDKS
ncbi:hypothetical protein [Streptomyces sp. NPDC094032]|uniref:hypothetical protein n=1 Tax=Streptomyces sp. NPDC094032 TaxID=3155308 RepID=UPI0033270A21